MALLGIFMPAQLVVDLLLNLTPQGQTLTATLDIAPHLSHFFLGIGMIMVTWRKRAGYNLHPCWRKHAGTRAPEHA